MASVEQLLHDRRLLLDVALALVVGLMSAAPYASASAPAAAATLLLASSLALRRVLPAAALVVGGLGALGQLLSYPAPMFGIVVVPVLIYSVARWGGQQLGRSALMLGLLGSLLGPARWALSVGNAGTALIYFAMGVTGCAGIVLAAYLVGSRFREGAEVSRERELSELERSRLRFAEEEQRAAVAAVDERNRIARELHDIVAHSLSV